MQSYEVGQTQSALLVQPAKQANNAHFMFPAPHLSCLLFALVTVVLYQGHACQSVCTFRQPSIKRIYVIFSIRNPQ